METKKKKGVSSFIIKSYVSLVKFVNSILERIFKLPLYLTVLLTSFLISIPIVAVWSFFSLMNFLPNPWRAILIWGLYFLLVILTAAADYVRSS